MAGVKNIHDFAILVSRIEFGAWKFHIGMDGDRPYLQLKFWANCSKTGKAEWWTSRKWSLSPYMTDSEVIGTAFKAVMTAVEHETRENFKYRGKAIFGPHIDVEALHSVADKVDVRTPA